MVFLKLSELTSSVGVFRFDPGRFEQKNIKLVCIASDMKAQPFGVITIYSQNNESSLLTDMFRHWHGSLLIFLVFNVQQYFRYIMATRFSGRRSRSTRREPPTIGKQLVNFITCGCESSAPFFVVYKVGRESTPYLWYACMSC